MNNESKKVLNELRKAISRSFFRGGLNLKWIIILFVFALGSYIVNESLASTGYVDEWLNKDFQQNLLKNCYYDHSFKEQILKKLTQIIKRLEVQFNEEADKYSLGVFKTRPSPGKFLEVQTKLEEVRRFREAVMFDDYVTELMKVLMNQRHLDNWDLF